MARSHAIDIEIHSETACIIVLRGEHDVSSKPALSATLVEAAAYRNVLVDLSECTFIEASLSSALVRAAQRLRAGDGALELVVPGRAHVVRRMLEVAKVQTIVPFHATRAAGIASIDSAERLHAHRDELQRLRDVSARIDQLQAKTELSRARQLVGARPGVTVVRAQIVAGPGALAAERDRRPGA